MNVPLSIARRYLFSKGNRNVINIISAIASVGVGIGSLAMIVILSAFNGLESLVADLYTTVDPDIRVTPVLGKTFATDSIGLEEIAQWEEVDMAAPILEETVFLQFRDQQNIVTMRGIPPAYLPKLKLDEYLIEGELKLEHIGLDGAIMGYGIADNLNLFIRDAVESIKVYAAKRDGVNSLNPQNKFVSERIMPMGIVALNPEFDFKYFYTTHQFAEQLLQYENRSSYLDISLTLGADEHAAKERLQAHLGNGFEVKTRLELNDVLFKTNATEKWVTFFILSFIMMVATFNLIGNLSMLIIDKRQDINLLRSIGSTRMDVRKLFLFEGLMITGLGAFSGLVIGAVVLLIQQHIGFFPLQGGLVEYYPVELQLMDVLAVAFMALTIGFVASLIPVSVLLKSSRLQTISTS